MDREQMGKIDENTRDELRRLLREKERQDLVISKIVFLSLNRKKQTRRPCKIYKPRLTI